MKRSEINILKNLNNFTFDYNESDNIDDFFIKFGVAVNSSGEGGYHNGLIDIFLFQS